jgi:hypothetical protein
LIIIHLVFELGNDIRAKHDHNTMKTKNKLHPTLDYNKTYIFVINHGHKILTFLLIKDIWKLESNMGIQNDSSMFQVL